MIDLTTATLNSLKEYALDVLLLDADDVKKHGKLSAKATWIKAIEHDLAQNAVVDAANDRANAWKNEDKKEEVTPAATVEPEAPVTRSIAQALIDEGYVQEEDEEYSDPELLVDNSDNEDMDYTDVHPIQGRMSASTPKFIQPLSTPGIPSTAPQNSEPMVILLVCLYVLLLHAWSLTAPLVKVSNHTRKSVIREIKEQWHAGKRLVLAQP